MLAEQRRNHILDILAEKGAVTVNQLHHRLKVSQETIRRDITKLAAENRLRKTHGGALALAQVEPEFADRMAVNIDGKRAIGALAAGLVPDGASVIIDSGTTTLCLAEALMAHQGLTVFTNDMNVAGKLAGRNDNRVHMLGGELIGNEGATAGRDTTTMLQNYLTDFSFIGASALDAVTLLTDYSREIAELRAQMMVQGRTAVLLADSSKFGKRAPVRVNHLDQLTHLISDAKMSSGLLTAVRKLNVEVIIAKPVR
ncbi:MAG: DeoR/GlpR transcriptional regulator [Rhodospirillales bacterium]|nr:DeoR/GlpR transcriptional regulator [Rhodospirillales bacterium]